MQLIPHKPFVCGLCVLESEMKMVSRIPYILTSLVFELNFQPFYFWFSVADVSLTQKLLFGSKRPYFTYQIDWNYFLGDKKIYVSMITAAIESLLKGAKLFTS